MHIAWASDLRPLCKLLQGCAKMLASIYISFCCFVLLTCSMHTSVNTGSDWKLAHLQTAASISAEVSSDMAWSTMVKEVPELLQAQKEFSFFTHARGWGMMKARLVFLQCFLIGDL